MRDICPLHSIGRTRSTPRSTHRPEPLGLRRVGVRETAGTRPRVGPIEAIDGTPVVDVKVALGGDAVREHGTMRDPGANRCATRRSMASPGMPAPGNDRPR